MPAANGEYAGRAPHPASAGARKAVERLGSDRHPRAATPQDQE